MDDFTLLFRTLAGEPTQREIIEMLNPEKMNAIEVIYLMRKIKPLIDKLNEAFGFGEDKEGAE